MVKGVKKDKGTWRHGIIFMAILLTVSVFSTGKCAKAAPWDGTTSKGWYENNKDKRIFYISTAEELAYMAVLVNNTSETFMDKEIRLKEDIILNGEECYTQDANGSFALNPAISKPWTVISKAGTYEQLQAGTAKMFQGCFDGQGHTIHGLYLPNTVLTKYKGLFGCLGIGAMVKNLNVEHFCMEDIYHNSYQDVDNIKCIYASGVIAGYATGAVIENCSVSKGYIYTQYCAAGIAGDVKDTVIRQCSTDYDIVTEHGATTLCMGGIVAWTNSNVEDCSSSYRLLSKADYCGGIIGIMRELPAELQGVNKRKIKNCRYNGSMKADGYVVGGIAASAYDVEIQGCMVDASLCSRGYLGGITGMLSRGDILACGIKGNLKGSLQGKCDAGGIVGEVRHSSTLKNSYVDAYLENNPENIDKGGCFYGDGSPSSVKVDDCIYNTDKVGQGIKGIVHAQDRKTCTGLDSAAIKRGIAAHLLDLNKKGKHLNLWTQKGESPKLITDRYETPIYRIRFSYDDTELDCYTAEDGKLQEEIPEFPAKEGYEGDWSCKNFNNIAEDKEVYPIYRTKYCRVNYYKGETKTASRIYPYGSGVLEMPDIPFKTGYIGSYGEEGQLRYLVRDVDVSLTYTPVRYTICYDGNGGNGISLCEQNCLYDKEYHLYGNTMYEKEGYRLVGWNTQKDGSGEEFAPDAVIKNLSAVDGEKITLYAIWESTSPAVLLSGDTITRKMVSLQNDAQTLQGDENEQQNDRGQEKESLYQNNVISAWTRIIRALNKRLDIRLMRIVLTKGEKRYGLYTGKKVQRLLKKSR